MLDEILQYLEGNIDLEHIDKTKQCLSKVMNYQKTDYFPVKVGYPNNRFIPYPYPEAFADMEKMMCNELIATIGGIELKDATVPMIRANYGVGTLPSLFGLHCRLINNDLPWVDHLSSTDKVKELIDRGVPDLRDGLGARVLETHEYYRMVLERYPKCKKGIPVYHTDLQGPFDVAHLIWGSDIYYALYDYQDVVHELMNLVTETYIVFMKQLKKTINDEWEDCNYHWGTIYKGSVVVRNDSTVNLSKDMYEEFVRPYDERILKKFGGGSIHYCGRADQWVFNMMECEGLGALNFGQPPNMIFGFDFLDKIFGKAKEKKIPIISYIMKKGLIEDILSSGYTTGVTFSIGADNRAEAQKILKMCNGYI